MAYVQSVEQQTNADAQAVHDQLQALIIAAREQALVDELSHDRFREALFPVVAWCDERLGNLPAWKLNRDWRPFMLQKKIFSTSLAGVLFYDRLEELSQEDNDLRKVFVLCLSMGFLGRYSQHPGDPALVQIRLAHYKLIRPNRVVSNKDSNEHLFPEAYRVASSDNSQRQRKLKQRRFLLIAVLGPLFLIFALALTFNYDLTKKINTVTQMFKL